MASFQKVENKLVTCPYDEAHKVKESRLQLHIAKCRLNHLDQPMDVCPFNAKHVLPRNELNHHILNCPDKAPLDRKLAQSIDKNNPYKGRTAVPSYSEPILVNIGENWDEEISSAPEAGYVPPAAPPSGGIFEPPPMSKPSERKKMYQELHRMNAEPDKPQEPPAKPQVTPVVPRQPKQPSEAYKLQTLQKQNLDYENLGLGRGKAPQGSRIAANIFPVNSQPVSNGLSYSDITNGLSQLGLGRGRASNIVAAPQYDDDEFPSLGCGRGLHQYSKNVTKVPGSRNPQ